MSVNASQPRIQDDLQTSMEKGHKPLVQVEHLYFSYGHHLVLSDITFDIMAGDFLAIIGPNGSGKSTLIKLILGLLSPERGRINILGAPVASFKHWEQIGYVPQKATRIDMLFPISVAEVVALGRIAAKSFPRWMNRTDARLVHEALEQVGMAPLSNTKIRELSGGQQQKVFIAKAIVNHPKILFLDEPTTGIDAGSQENFYHLLGDLNREGITIVMVTHDIGVVTHYVNKVACLNQRLVFHGTHEEFCSSKEARALIPGHNHLILHRH